MGAEVFVEVWAQVIVARRARSASAAGEHFENFILSQVWCASLESKKRERNQSRRGIGMIEGMGMGQSVFGNEQQRFASSVKDVRATREGRVRKRIELEAGNSNEV